MYRNGSKAGIIPRDKLSTKISGLAIDTDYTFHLVLRTSAGQYSSEKLTIKTHKMTDLTGITVTPGIMPNQLKDSLAETVNKIGAKMIDTVRIDTTHFITTEPRGQAWEKAVEMNVPVVVPDWLKGCEREGRIVGVRGYYLDADPKLRQIGPGAGMQSRSSTQTAPVRDSPRIEHTPPTPERATREELPDRTRTNGAPAESEPPTPPPKPATERFAEESRSPEPDERSIAGATAVNEKQHEEDEDSDDDSEATEKGEAEENNLKAVGIPHEQPDSSAQTSEAEAVAVAEEDGKFDEVAL